MTLADLLRRYLDDRRKRCEEKARSLRFVNERQYFSRENESNTSESNSNPKLFSNTLKKKPKNDCAKCQSHKRSMTTRVVTLPDGKTQVETIIKDEKGNEEKHVTYQEGNKKYTIITRKDSTGNEKVEQKVSDVTDSKDLDNSTVFFPDQYFGINQNSESGYDYWPDNNSSQFPKNNIVPFDSDGIEENLTKILKRFGGEAFSGGFENQPSNNNSDKEWFMEDLFKNSDANFFGQEVQKFMEKFENETQFQNKRNHKNSDNKHSGMDVILKNFLTPRMPSLFQKYLEQSRIENVDEEIDELSEEQKKARVATLKQAEEMLKKLEKGEIRDTSDNFIYSDIQEPGNELSLFEPRTDSIPNIYNFGNIRSFGPINSNMRISSSSKMRFPNGNIRTETVKQDNSGNLEKSVTYQSGGKTYSVIIVTTPSGERIRKQRNYDFSESDLQNFKNQWDPKFQSDFSE